MSAEEPATPHSLIARRCPRCGTLMSPARDDPRTQSPERLRLPGPRGGEAIRLIRENGHLSVFLVHDVPRGGEGDAERSSSRPDIPKLRRSPSAGDDDKETDKETPITGKTAASSRRSGGYRKPHFRDAYSPRRTNVHTTRKGVLVRRTRRGDVQQ